MTLAEANEDIREMVAERLSTWRLNEDYPPFIETSPVNQSVLTEEDTNNQAQRLAEGG